MEERNYTEEEKKRIIENFNAKLINQMVDTPVEFQDIVNENFWELLDES